MHHVCDKKLAINLQAREAAARNMCDGMWRHTKTSFGLRYVAAYYYVIIDMYTEIKRQLLWLYFCLNYYFVKIHLKLKISSAENDRYQIQYSVCYCLNYLTCKLNPFFAPYCIRWPACICCIFGNYLVQWRCAASRTLPGSIPGRVTGFFSDIFPSD
jgi:hypothetical protein